MTKTIEVKFGNPSNIIVDGVTFGLMPKKIKIFGSLGKENNCASIEFTYSSTRGLEEDLLIFKKISELVKYREDLGELNPAQIGLEKEGKKFERKYYMYFDNLKKEYNILMNND